MGAHSGSTGRFRPLEGLYTETSFDGADLSRRSLVGIHFVNCSFLNSDLSGSDLSYARFTGCDLYRAKFDGSVLYATWFVDSNLTKTSFSGAYLSGFRSFDCDITKTEFDSAQPRISGKVRRGTSTPLPLTGRYWVSNLGERLPLEAGMMDEEFDGIAVATHERRVEFESDEDLDDGERMRALRRGEILRALKRLHLEAGYFDKAIGFHIHERRAWRSGNRSAWKRFLDWLFQDVLWLYGTSVFRPIVALIVWALAITAVLLWLPHVSPNSGITITCSVGRCIRPLSGWSHVSQIPVYLITSPAGGSGFEVIGWGREAFAIFVVGALILLALAFQSATRRLSHFS